MSNVLLFLIILFTTLSIVTAVLLAYLKWALKKRIYRTSDMIYRNLIDEIDFYITLDSKKEDLLEEDRVSTGFWYWHFAYDVETGFGCFMPMNDLFGIPDFSDVLDNVQRSYLVGVTKNGELEFFTPMELLYDWYGRK